MSYPPGVSDSGSRPGTVLIALFREWQVQRQWAKVIAPSCPSNPFEVGLALRVSRSRARLSLEKVRELTDVPVAFLEALERGDLVDLPSAEAVSVCLRRFAMVVGLDGNTFEEVCRSGGNLPVHIGAGHVSTMLEMSRTAPTPHEVVRPLEGGCPTPSSAISNVGERSSSATVDRRHRRKGNRVPTGAHDFARSYRKAISIVGATCLVASIVATVSVLPAGALTASIFAFGSNGFACSAPSGGNLYCWGANGQGQLGNGTTTTSVTPVEVEGVGGTGFLSGVVSVAAGAYSVCAATSDGSVYCWGEDPDGELGNNTTGVSSSTPVQVEGVGGAGYLSGVTQVVGMESETFCALTSTSNVYCWGNNANGQLGNNTNDASDATPVEVTGSGGTGFLSGVTSLSPDQGIAVCALVSSNVYCWGSDAQSQIGTTAGSGNTMAGGFETPQEVQGVGGTGYLSNVTSVSMGKEHACALTSATNVYCWGKNIAGALGDGMSGTHNASQTPVEVEGVGGSGELSGVTELSAGGDETCAVVSGGTAYCWGTGYLGNGTGNLTTTPVAVKNPAGTATWTNVSNIWVEYNVQAYTTTCATTNGSLYCWGVNLGALGFAETTGVNTELPMQVGVFNGPSSSTTSLSTSASSTPFGQSVTLTATVVGSNPSGSVTFLDGSTSLGTATLNGLGVATLTTSALAVGSHSLTASYGGDANNLSSTSSLVGETISSITSVSTSGNTGTSTSTTTVVTTTVPTPGTQAIPTSTEQPTLSLATPEGSVGTSTVTLGFTCQSTTPCNETGRLSVARANRTRPNQFTHLVLAVGHIEVPANASATTSFVITSMGNIVLPERRHFYRKFRMTLQMITASGASSSRPVHIPGTAG